MLKFKELPKNPEYFSKLINFAKDCLKICKEIKATPIVYGSVAYFIYTKDKAISIHDVDFLVSQVHFEELKTKLEKLGLRTEATEYHSLKAYKGDVKISFDAYEHYLKNIPYTSTDVMINKVEFKVINLSALREFYKRGVEGTSSVPSKIESYTYKLNKLNEIK